MQATEIRETTKQNEKHKIENQGERRSRWDLLEKKKKQAIKRQTERIEKRNNWDKEIKRATESMQTPKTMVDSIENIEEEDKQLVRAIRGPAMQKGNSNNLYRCMHDNRGRQVQHVSLL